MLEKSTSAKCNSRFQHHKETIRWLLPRLLTKTRNSNVVLVVFPQDFGQNLIRGTTVAPNSDSRASRVGRIVGTVVSVLVFSNNPLWAVIGLEKPNPSERVGLSDVVSVIFSV